MGEELKIPRGVRRFFLRSGIAQLISEQLSAKGIAVDSIMAYPDVGPATAANIMATLSALGVGVLWKWEDTALASTPSQGRDHDAAR
jgi:hypothetical protein